MVVGQRAIRTGEGIRIKRTRRLAARSRSLPAGERWRVSIAGPVEDGTTRVAVHLYVDRSPAEGAPDARLHAWLPRDGRGAAGDERGAVVRNGRRAITEFRSRANPHAALARLARSYLADVPGVPESGASVASRADASTEGPSSGVWEPDDRE